MEIEFHSGTFIAMMVNFIILMFVLVRLLYRPIQGILEQRRQKILNDLNEANQSKELAERLYKEAQIALEEAHVEAYEIVEKARNEAERLSQELTEQTRRELDQLRKRAIQEIERAKLNAREQMREEAITLALSAVHKLISSNMSAQINGDLIRRAVDEIAKGDRQHDIPGGA